MPRSHQMAAHMAAHHTDADPGNLHALRFELRQASKAVRERGAPTRQTDRRLFPHGVFVCVCVHRRHIEQTHWSLDGE